MTGEFHAPIDKKAVASAKTIGTSKSSILPLLLFNGGFKQRNLSLVSIKTRLYA